VKKIKRLLSVFLVVLLVSNLFVSNVKALDVVSPKARLVRAGETHSFAIYEQWP